MEPTATVRRRPMTFSERMILSRWGRSEIPHHRVTLVLLFASLAILHVVLAFAFFPEWAEAVWERYLSLLGPARRSMLERVARAAAIAASAFVLVTLVLAIWGLIKSFRVLWDRVLDQAYFEAVELHVRNARFVTGAGEERARPWVLIAVAPGRVLYHSAWSSGERHPPSPVDSFPPERFPSEFRLLLHSWHRSILRIEPLGPLVASAGTLSTPEVPALPDGGITRSPLDRWALFEGDLEHPASLRRIACDSVAAIEAALAPAT
ncbi:MAG TPA: hypothetical protein VFS92_10105 [Planctomycetota bacterium]|nr:hypothetical protein [Planctomycetota bacterium]